MEERKEHREIFLKKLIEGLNKENVEYSFLKKEPEEKPVTKDEMIWVIEKKSGTKKMLLNVPVFDPSDMDRCINEIIGAVGKALNKIKRDTYNCAEIINETKNYETVKDNLFLKAVNISKEKIKKGVYMPVSGDVVLTLCMVLSSNDEEMLSFIIPKEYFFEWERNPMDVFSAAMDNTIKILSPRLISKEKYDAGEDGVEFMNKNYSFLRKDQGTILTSKHKINGASIIFMPQVLNRISQLIGGDFLFITMNSDEAFIYDASRDTEEVKIALYCSINENIEKGNMEYQDVLSTHVFKFNASKGKIEIAE